MKTIYCPALSLTGVSVRTKNADEMDAATAKIGPLWQHFYRDVYPEKLSGEAIYGVYFNYASDADGKYDVMVAVESSDAAHNEATYETIDLAAGRYGVFLTQTGEGNPVFQLWQQVWHYFEQADCPYQRNWKTDYEIYHQDGKIELRIGIL